MRERTAGALFCIHKKPGTGRHTFGRKGREGDCICFRGPLGIGRRDERIFPLSSTIALRPGIARKREYVTGRGRGGYLQVMPLLQPYGAVVVPLTRDDYAARARRQMRGIG